MGAASYDGASRQGIHAQAVPVLDHPREAIEQQLGVPAREPGLEHRLLHTHGTPSCCSIASRG